MIISRPGRAAVVTLVLCITGTSAAWLRSEFYVDSIHMPTPSREGQFHVESAFGSFIVAYTSDTFSVPYAWKAQSHETAVVMQELQEASDMFRREGGADLPFDPRHNIPAWHRMRNDSPGHTFRHYAIVLPYWVVLALLGFGLIVVVSRRKWRGSSAPVEQSDPHHADP